MDNIIINSMNAGNLGLLESSINSKEFKQLINERKYQVCKENLK
jgi:hypothetical protein